MKLGWTEEEMMKWLPTKLCGWALNAVSDLPRGYWRSTPGKQTWTLTETLYQFDIRLSDNPLLYEQSYNLFVRGKARSRAEFIKTSNTMDRRVRQQYSQGQVIDTIGNVDASLNNEFRQPGKSSEVFGIGSRRVASRNGPFSKDLFGEVGHTRAVGSCSRRRIPGYGDEVQTASEVEFTEEVCGQVNQEIYRAALTNMKTVASKKFRQKRKSLSTVLILVDQMSILLWKRILSCHQSLGS